jgi:hypothetical protein
MLRSNCTKRGPLFWALCACAVTATGPTQTRVGFSPPGLCTPVPRGQWILDRTIIQSSPPDPKYPFEHSDRVAMGVSEPFDLDGDGVRDVLVPEPGPGDCTMDFHFAIYIKRGACGHRVGIVYGNIDATALSSAPRHAGLPELTTRTERQQQPDPRVPAELRVETRTYRFDGVAYREVHQTVTTSVCHHCPSVRCVHSSAAP